MDGGRRPARARFVYICWTDATLDLVAEKAREGEPKKRTARLKDR